MDSLKVLYGIVFFACLVFFCSCSSKKSYVMNASALKEVKTVDLCIVLAQQEIFAEIKQSNITQYTLGGAIPAIIDASIDHHRAKDSENSIQPIRNALVDYDFGKHLAGKIQAELNLVNTIKSDKVTFTNNIKKEGYKKEFAESCAQAVLFVSPNYYLSPDFKILKITGGIKLFPTSMGSAFDPTDDNQCVYKDSFSYQESAENSVSSKESAVGYWSDNSGEHMRQALDQASADIAKKIALNLNQ